MGVCNQTLPKERYRVNENENNFLFGVCHDGAGKARAFPAYAVPREMTPFSTVKSALPACMSRSISAMWGWQVKYRS